LELILKNHNLFNMLSRQMAGFRDHFRGRGLRYSVSGVAKTSQRDVSGQKPVSGAGFHAVGSAKCLILGAGLVGHALPVHGDAQIGLAQVGADGPIRLAPHIFRALPVKICSAKL